VARGEDVSTVIPTYKISAAKFFVTGDTHYDHANICRGTSKWPPEETRDFDTLEQMNDTLERWRAVPPR